MANMYGRERARKSKSGEKSISSRIPFMDTDRGLEVDMTQGLRKSYLDQSVEKHTGQ